LQDALVVNFINNTVVSNDTTASSGVLFNTLGAPIASSNGPCPGNSNPSNTNPCVTTSTPQPAGLVAIQNSATLRTDLGPLTVTCPSAHPNCKAVSYPVLENNLFWQNRAFNISVGTLGNGTTNQQNVVALIPTLNQPQTDATTANGTGVVVTGGTGACTTGASYWDIGVRLDRSATTHESGITLAPTWSVLTSLNGGYATASLHNSATNPTVMSQYCNGSRIPPELGTAGYMVPPGISDATVPNPIFNLTPAATVDEGNNWINMSWGPLALTHPLHPAQILGNYALASSSTDIDAIGTTASSYGDAPTTDFFGNPRKNTTAVNVNGTVFPPNPCVDIGAVDIVKSTTCGGTGGGGGQGTLSFTSATNATLGSLLGIRTLTFTIPTPRAPVTSVITITNTGTGSLQITAENLPLNIGGLYSITGTTCSFTTPLAANGTCTVSVRYATPTTRPILPDIGTLSVANNGTGTTGGNSTLVLSAQ
jgi:hypothetical protein